MPQRPNHHEPSYLSRSTDDLTQRILWLWNNQKLVVERGKSHGKDPSWGEQGVEQFFRGWYDPSTQDLFVVGPAPRRRNTPPPPLRSIPRILDRVLRRRFGDDLHYRAF